MFDFRLNVNYNLIKYIYYNQVGMYDIYDGWNICDGDRTSQPCAYYNLVISDLYNQFI